jgi:integrase/recombinase XerD
MIPSVKIYSVHSTKCPNKGNGYALNCNCRKWLRYSHDGKQICKSAGTRSLRDAEKARRKVEDKFEALASGKAAPLELDQKTLTQAVDHFLKVRTQRGKIEPNTLKAYARDLKRLDEFMGKLGRFYPSQITEHDLVEFKATWATYVDIQGAVRKTNSKTKIKLQQKLKAFFKYCVRFKLIEAVPHLDPIDVPEDEQRETLPLVKEGYHQAFERLLQAVDQVFEGDKAQRARGLLLVMAHSGLAITDAVSLRRDELKVPNGKPHHRIEKRRTKTGVAINNVIPQRVAEELLAVPNENPDYVFWSNAGGGKVSSAVKNWAKDFRKVFKAAGLPKGHLHMLRDYYAISLLEQGVPLEDVSRALGHKSTMTTEKHYAPWVPARQARLDDVIAATWAKPLAAV